MKKKEVKILSVILVTVFVLSLILFFGTNAKASEIGHADSVIIKSKDVKIPRNLAEEIYKKLDKLKRIEKAEPEIKLGEIKAFTDQNGRIFINDTTSVSMKLADIEYAGELKLNAKTEVYRVPEKQKKWYNNFGWSYAMIQKDKDSSKLEKGQFYLTYDLFGYKRFGSLIEANIFHYGLGLFYKIGNAKLIVSEMIKYGDKINHDNSMLMVGVGYNF